MDKRDILTKIKGLFSSEEVVTPEIFTQDYKTQDGRIIRCYGKGLTIGDEVKEITPDGEIDLEDADYILEDGMVLSIMGGKITEIEEVTTEEDMEVPTSEDEVFVDYVETTLMDGTKVRVEGKDLLVGAKAEVEVDGEWVIAPEGQHDLSDGRVIYVDAEGLINEVETPETKKEDNINMDEVFSALSTLVDEMKSLKEELKTIKNDNQDLVSRVNKFAADPSEAPIKKEISFNKNTKEDRLKFFAR
jgi:hypothetical protein